MTLPIDLVFVRHGQSEGNAAKQLSKAGKHDAIGDVFRERHTRSFRLTDLGRTQAQAAGAWIRQEFFKDGIGFDRYYTSEYARAMETAVLLDLPHAEWFRDFNLTERNWGRLDAIPEHERHAQYGKELALRNVEPFFWTPPSGESFAELCRRLRDVLQTLHRECTDKRVLIVCHGEVMWAFRILLERMEQRRFKELHLSERDEDRIYNCQILHYTRRDPGNRRRLAPHAGWMRAIRPAGDPVWTMGWQEIVRPRYSNEDLREEVEVYPRILE